MGNPIRIVKWDNSCPSCGKPMHRDRKKWNCENVQCELINLQYNGDTMYEFKMKSESDR